MLKYAMKQTKPKLIYWKIGMAVRATTVYLDANFIVGLNKTDHVWHTTATALLEHFRQRQIILILSALALNEAIYQLIRLQQKEVETIEMEQRTLGLRLEETLFNLPNLRHFEPATADFHRQTLNAIQTLNLDPTDAFHYTAARHLNCPLVSNDGGFQKIPDANLTIVTFF